MEGEPVPPMDASHAGDAESSCLVQVSSSRTARDWHVTGQVIRAHARRAWLDMDTRVPSCPWPLMAFRLPRGIDTALAVGECVDLLRADPSVLAMAAFSHR